MNEDRLEDGNEDNIKLHRGILTPYFKPDSLERAFFFHQFERFGKQNAKFFTVLGVFIFFIYAVYDYILFINESLMPALMMVVNMIDAIIAAVWTRRRPMHGRYLVYYVLAGLWVWSGCFAGAYLPFENVYIFLSTFYFFVDHSTQLVNVVVLGCVFFRIVFDYWYGKPFIFVWSITLIIAFFWCYIVAYEANMIARKIFMLSRKKDRTKAGLLAKKNSRLMFDLVIERSTGSLKVVKKDILTNTVIDETIEDESDGRVTPDSESVADDSSYYNSLGSVSSTTETSLDSAMDRESWLRGSMGTLKKIGSLGVLVHVFLSLLNWAIIPNDLTELRFYLFSYHVYVELPLAIYLLVFIIFSKYVNTYNRYTRTLEVLFTLSIITSWSEVILINSFDPDGAITQNLITRLFLIFSIRHSFSFQSSKHRIAGASIDFVVFMLMVVYGNFWRNRFTPHQKSTSLPNRSR